MPVLREGLAGVIEARMRELNLNPYDVARRSGDRISHTTVRNITSRHVREIKDETMEVLSDVLDIPLRRMYALSRNEGEVVESTYEERFRDMALKFERLDEGEKMAMEDIIAMVERELERRGRIQPRGAREAETKRTRK